MIYNGINNRQQGLTPDDKWKSQFRFGGGTPAPTGGGLVRPQSGFDPGSFTNAFNQDTLTIKTGQLNGFEPQSDLLKSFTQQNSAIPQPFQNAQHRWTQAATGAGGGLMDTQADPFSPDRRQWGVENGRINAHATADTKQFQDSRTPDAQWNSQFQSHQSTPGATFRINTKQELNA